MRWKRRLGCAAADQEWVCGRGSGITTMMMRRRREVFWEEDASSAGRVDMFFSRSTANIAVA
jgi:hypothetical protein